MTTPTPVFGSATREQVVEWCAAAATKASEYTPSEMRAKISQGWVEQFVPPFPTKRRRVELFEGANVFASFHHRSSELGPLFHSWSNGVQSGASWTVAAILYTYCDNVCNPRPDQIAIVNMLAELAENPDEPAPAPGALRDGPQWRELTWEQCEHIGALCVRLTSRYQDAREVNAYLRSEWGAPVGGGMAVYGYAVRENGWHSNTIAVVDGDCARAEDAVRKLAARYDGRTIIHTLYDGGPIARVESGA